MCPNITKDKQLIDSTHEIILKVNIIKVLLAQDKQLIDSTHEISLEVNIVKVLSNHGCK